MAVHLLIAPGGSRNDPLAELIGVFGVGAKRAAIALAENIEIRTRHENGGTHELDITKQWIESDAIVIYPLTRDPTSANALGKSICPTCISHSLRLTLIICAST
jgi:hypothetical protein